MPTSAWERIYRGQAATIHATFEVDGELEQPTSPTVVVTRADGTELVASTGATSVASGATYLLPAAKTTALNTLTATWSGTVNGATMTVETTVEIADAPYFTVAQARDDDKLAGRLPDDSYKYPTDEVMYYRALAEQAIEDKLAVAFVPRHHRETFTGTDTSSLMLSRQPVRSLRTLTVDGTDRLSDATIVAGRFVTGAYFPTDSAVVVEYEYGEDRPPARIARAALLLAKAWLIHGPIDDRETQVSAGDGGVINLATPGRWGSIFGIPEVDAAIAGDRRKGLTL